MHDTTPRCSVEQHEPDGFRLLGERAEHRPEAEPRKRSSNGLRDCAGRQTAEAHHSGEPHHGLPTGRRLRGEQAPPCTDTIESPSHHAEPLHVQLDRVTD